MHKEVNSMLSIALIFVAAIGIFVMSRVGMEKIPTGFHIRTLSKQKSIEAKENVSENNADGGQTYACKERMFEGEVKLKVWRDGEPVDSAEKEIIIRVKNEDAKKLPIILSDESSKNFKARLVDATQEVELEINKHSEQDPAEVTVRGFKYNCDGMSMMSLGTPEQSLKNI